MGITQCNMFSDASFTKYGEDNKVIFYFTSEPWPYVTPWKLEIRPISMEWSQRRIWVIREEREGKKTSCEYTLLLLLLLCESVIFSLYRVLGRYKAWIPIRIPKRACFGIWGFVIDRMMELGQKS